MPWRLYGTGGESQPSAPPCLGAIEPTCSFDGSKTICREAARIGTRAAISPRMVRLTVALTAASARGAQNLLDALRFLSVSARLESGCLGCSAWMDSDSTVRYAEEWATEADIRRRVRSESFTSLLAVVESAQEPQVQFDFVTATRGLDFVAEVRSNGVR